MPDDQRLRLRAALGRHVGKVMLPDVAASIELEAMQEPELGVDPHRFEPLQHSGCVIRLESFRAIREELRPLHEAHWQETEKHRHGLTLQPDYEAICADERAGRLLQFTVRKDGALIGHLRMYLLRSRHTGTLFGQEDTLFILPRHRGGFLVMALMRYAESTLVALGAREVRADSKLVNRADVLMRRMGYQPVALSFHKYLGK